MMRRLEKSVGFDDLRELSRQEDAVVGRQEPVAKPLVAAPNA